MKIQLSPGSHAILERHLDNYNQTVLDENEDPIPFDQQRVEDLINSLIDQIDQEGDNIFEEYDDNL